MTSFVGLFLSMPVKFVCGAHLATKMNNLRLLIVFLLYVTEINSPYISDTNKFQCIFIVMISPDGVVRRKVYSS